MKFYKPGFMVNEEEATKKFVEAVQEGNVDKAKHYLQMTKTRMGYNSNNNAYTYKGTKVNNRKIKHGKYYKGNLYNLINAYNDKEKAKTMKNLLEEYNIPSRKVYLEEKKQKEKEKKYNSYWQSMNNGVGSTSHRPRTLGPKKNTTGKHGTRKSNRVRVYTEGGSKTRKNNNRK